MDRCFCLAHCTAPDLNDSLALWQQLCQVFQELVFPFQPFRRLTAESHRKDYTPCVVILFMCVHVSVCVWMDVCFCSVSNSAVQNLYIHNNSLYKFSPPLVTVSKSAESSSLYYTEWDEARKLIEAGSPHGLPTCRVSLSSDKDKLCCSVCAVTQDLCLIG